MSDEIHEGELILGLLMEFQMSDEDINSRFEGGIEH